MISLIHGDAKKELLKLKKESVDLIITSPPYDNLRSYGGHAFDFETFTALASGMYGVLKFGGVIVWVVSDQTIKGSETGTSFKQALHFMELGFRLHDTMIWEKDHGVFPDKNRYNQVFEFMFVFSKGSPKTINKINDRKNKCFNGRKVIKGHERDRRGNIDYSKKRKGNLLREFGCRNNIWKIPVGFGKSSKDKLAFKHPAIFPEKLAHDHIISWSNEGDLILDPMCGSGTVGKMARLLKRDFIGIEIEEKYINISRERINL